MMLIIVLENVKFSGAYVCYRPDIGYVQSMSFIAAIILLQMEPFSAFVAFSNLLNRPLQVCLVKIVYFSLLIAWKIHFQSQFCEIMGKGNIFHLNEHYSQTLFDNFSGNCDYSFISDRIFRREAVRDNSVFYCIRSIFRTGIARSA